MSEMVCPDCGLVLWGPGNISPPFCAFQDSDSCRKRLIAILRAELATLREREQLERAVVEAAIVHRRARLALLGLSLDADSDDVLCHEVDVLLAHRRATNADR